jgi:MerR family copper efflux transcriptional regulator
VIRAHAPSSADSNPRRLTIGDLAERAGVNVATVRYYERRGIIREPLRTASGYRQYDASTVDRIRFVKRAQELGFTLDQIGDLLELRVTDPEACPAVEKVARGKLAEVESKIAELTRLKDVLEGLIRACGDREVTRECPVLLILEEEEVRP